MDKRMEQRFRRIGAANKVFTPAAPVSRKALFSGRTEQIGRAMSIISQRGQHGIIFGERGVGKTSLVNVLHYFYPHSDPLDPQTIETPRVNANSQQTYHSLWHEIFSKLPLIQEKDPKAGFTSQPSLELSSYADLVGEEKITPGIVENILSRASAQTRLIVIIDEFDRVEDRALKRLMADTIKTLSDHSIGATLILVGVASTVEELIGEHQSIERALVQIQMPRMESDELREIVTSGLNNFNLLSKDFQLSMSEEVVGTICFLSRGLPTYPHLLGLHGALKAIAENKNEITRLHLFAGMDEALKDVQQSTLSAYQKATRSAHKENRFAAILTACALARSDALGLFAASDVRGPLCKIVGKQLEISSFMSHLNDFCDPKRGPVLQRTGDKRSYRFRFTDALMEPYVVMRAIQDEILKLNGDGLP